MRSKEQILLELKKNYKPCFLLAWQRFLTYDEMKKINMLEPYDAALEAKQIKSSKDWNNLVLNYSRENLLAGLCILMRKLYNVIVSENMVMCSIYASDVKNWLYILNENEFYKDNILPINTFENINIFYTKIAELYKIEN